MSRARPRFFYGAIELTPYLTPEEFQARIELQNMLPDDRQQYPKRPLAQSKTESSTTDDSPRRESALIKK